MNKFMIFFLLFIKEEYNLKGGTIDKIINFFEFIQELLCWHQWIQWQYSNESVFSKNKEYCCLHCGKWKYTNENSNII